MTGAPSLGAARLTVLLVRSRFRSFRNGLGARGRRRQPLVIATVGLLTALAYVGLFAQAFSVVVATVDLPAQSEALALVVGALALGGFFAKAASSEAVRAGSAENEFLLARPISLPALVAARGLADAVTDPMGALFLLPVLLAAAVVWRLPPLAWVAAVATSVGVQVSISMLGYGTQLAVVGLVPARRRRAVWMALRLLAALALATVWMVGTSVLRAPASLARQLAALEPWLRFSPGRLIAAPLGALARGAFTASWASLGVLWLLAAGAVLAAAAIARRAGMRGWEEAGAPWAEAAPAPRRRSRPVTAATKDLYLIVRDRSQILVLVAMPAIFVGIQIFGAAGWAWSTASLPRVSCLAYSLALYMATIGPLTHMQAERRAFWILRTVPVPLGRLFAAKARAWAVVVAGAAAVVFGALVIAMPPAPLVDTIASAALVVVGATTMTFLAVAMAAGGADLSDEQSAAVGPATIYAYLLVGGLYNLVLTGDRTTRASGLALYAFVTAAYWQAGVERAELCLDADALRTPRLRIADGATLVVIGALATRGLAAGAAAARGEGATIFATLRVGLAATLGAIGASMLGRRRRRLSPPPALRSLLVGLTLGGAAGAAFGLTATPPAVATGPVTWLAIGVSLLAEEILFRGVVQGAFEDDLLGRGLSAKLARFVAAVVSAGLGVLATEMATGHAAGAVAAAAVIAAAAARALTGRVGAAFAARLAAGAIGLVI